MHCNAGNSAVKYLLLCSRLEGSESAAVMGMQMCTDRLFLSAFLKIKSCVPYPLTLLDMCTGNNFASVHVDLLKPALLLCTTRTVDCSSSVVCLKF